MNTYRCRTLWVHQDGERVWRYHEHQALNRRLALRAETGANKARLADGMGAEGWTYRVAGAALCVDT
jgi:hypothetical protein